MQSFWQIVASNALLAVVLAAGVALVSRLWKNPFGLHLLWVLVLLKLVTPPLVTVPLWERGSMLAAEEHRVGQPPATPSPVEASSQETFPSTTRGREHARLSYDLPAPESRAPGRSDALIAQRQGISWLTVLGLTWSLGIVLFASRQACRISGFRRLLRSSTASSSALLGMAAGVAKRLGLGRIPEMRLLPVCVSPLVWWLGARPQVFLPAALFERLDAAAQEAILAHELAHVRRKDHWVRLLEMVMTTLFWWHPVAWWAARQLRELEDQCCDCVVADMAPQAVKTYATALLDTLDFLSERSLSAPLGTTAAKSSLSLARRIGMLKNPHRGRRLTANRLVLLVAATALPMAVAFAAKPPEPRQPSAPDARRAAGQRRGESAVVPRRAVNKRVADFAEKADLSTPESAQAAWNRATAQKDARAIVQLSWTPLDPKAADQWFAAEQRRDPEGLAIYLQAVAESTILETEVYREELANVITLLPFPPGKGRDPYTSRAFGKINGVWKSLGEDRWPSLEAARETFARKKDGAWQSYVKLRDTIKNGQTSSAREQYGATGARIAPGEPRGITVEKADLMGRVEWAMMHGGRDITARKSIEWGDVQKDEKGNRSIRYKFDATIWDRDVYVMNMMFTFDAKGNIVSRENVTGFPQKKVEKPANVNTREGMKELVEDFFGKNFRDVTSRETMEWGSVAKAENGNSSIRYQYRAKIWDKDIKIMNQVFTFDASGRFVSVNNVDGFPRNP